MLDRGAVLEEFAAVPGIAAGDVTAAVINSTATDTTTASYLTVWVAGQPQPFTSSVNPDIGERHGGEHGHHPSQFE